MSVLHLTEQNFEDEVLSANIPVLVDFWAEWCGPCKMMGPIVEELAAALNGKIKIAKVNVDEAQELATRYGIMSIPTLMLFKGGRVIDQSIGVVGKEQLLARMNAHLGQ